MCIEGLRNYLDWKNFWCCRQGGCREPTGRAERQSSELRCSIPVGQVTYRCGAQLRFTAAVCSLAGTGVIWGQRWEVPFEKAAKFKHSKNHLICQLAFNKVDSLGEYLFQVTLKSSYVNSVHMWFYMWSGGWKCWIATTSPMAFQK